MLDELLDVVLELVGVDVLVVLDELVGVLDEDELEDDVGVLVDVCRLDVVELADELVVVLGPPDPDDAARAMTRPTTSAAATARTTGTIDEPPRRSSESLAQAGSEAIGGAGAGATGGTAAMVAAVG